MLSPFRVVLGVHPETDVTVTACWLTVVMPVIVTPLEMKVTGSGEVAAAGLVSVSDGGANPLMKFVETPPPAMFCTLGTRPETVEIPVIMLLPSVYAVNVNKSAGIA